MKLSTLYTTVPEYIEFAWVTAPNAAGQTFSANTVTTLTLTTEVADTGNLVSAPTSNQFTLPEGTYYFESNVPYAGGSREQAFILGLYNVTDSAWVSRRRTQDNGCAQGVASEALLSGQFVITSSKTFSLRALLNQSGAVVTNAGCSAYGLVGFTQSSPSDDQRTTIKLWKLK